MNRPSVVVIVLDDFGWTEYSLMSSLAAVAAQGMTFRRFYSQPVCTVSRIASLVGRLPRREGVGYLMTADVGQKTIPLDRVWIQEIFRDAGYVTNYVGKWHTGRAPGGDVLSGPTSQGFDFIDAGQIVAPIHWNGQEEYFNWWRDDNGVATNTTSYMTDVQRDAFVTRWSGSSGERMGWLCWNAPHPPFDIPPGGSSQSTQRAYYEQVIAYLNTAMTTVLASINLSDTYLVICTDNGPAETGKPIGADAWINKLTTREGGVRVPLIIAGPGIAGGTVSNRLVSMTDLPVTIAELCGVPIQYAPQGGGLEDSVSFADELGSQWKGNQPRTWLFTETYQPGWDDQAVIEKGWKLRRVLSNGSVVSTPANGDYYFRILAPGVETLVTPPVATQQRLLGYMNSLPPRAP